MAGVQFWSFSADERREFGTEKVWCWKVEDVSCCYCCKGATRSSELVGYFPLQKHCSCCLSLFPGLELL